MKNLKSFFTIISLCGLTALALQSSSASSMGGIAVIAPPSPPVQSVAPPSNISITNLVTGSSNVLWDASLLTNRLQHLDLNLPTGNSSSVEISWAGSFTQNGRGKLAGSGTNTEVTVILSDSGDSNTNTFTGKYISSGSVTSAKGVAHLTFSSRVSGKLLFPGESRASSVTASGVYTAKVDANNNTVTGHSSEHAAASGQGSTSKSKAFDPMTLSDLMPELGNGTWTLQIDFGTAVGNKLTGNASVTLNSGQQYPFSFTGVYNPRNGQSKLNLKGLEAGKGSSLQVTLDGTDITKVVGQVSGQSVNIK